MAIVETQYYKDVNLNGNTLIGFKTHPLTTTQRLSLGSLLTLEDEGYTVFDSEEHLPYYWTGGSWVPAGAGGGSSIQFVFNETPIGLVNGSNATFTTAFSFVPETVEISINGLGQRKLFHYNTIGNNTITFTESPQTGDTVEVDYIRL